MVRDFSKNKNGSLSQTLCMTSKHGRWGNGLNGCSWSWSSRVFVHWCIHVRLSTIAEANSLPGSFKNLLCCFLSKEAQIDDNSRSWSRRSVFVMSVSIESEELAVPVEIFSALFMVHHSSAVNHHALMGEVFHLLGMESWNQYFFHDLLGIKTNFLKEIRCFLPYLIHGLMTTVVRGRIACDNGSFRLGLAVPNHCSQELDLTGRQRFVPGSLTTASLVRTHGSILAESKWLICNDENHGTAFSLKIRLSSAIHCVLCDMRSLVQIRTRIPSIIFVQPFVHQMQAVHRMA
jgi:hypothetical protein